MFKFEIVNLFKFISVSLNKVSAAQLLKQVKYDEVMRLLTYVEQ